MNGIVAQGRAVPVASLRLASVAIGSLLVGLVDAIDAMLFSFLYRGASPGRVWQSVASGVLGRASFQGGAATVALGLAIHLFIATCVVTIYVIASRQWPVLARRWIAFGGLYGVGVYAVMNLVVIPLSAIGPVRPGLPAIINGILIHIVGVGMLSGWTATLAARESNGSQVDT